MAARQTKQDRNNKVNCVLRKIAQSINDVPIHDAPQREGCRVSRPALEARGVATDASLGVQVADADVRSRGPSAELGRCGRLPSALMREWRRSNKPMMSVTRFAGDASSSCAPSGGGWSASGDGGTAFALLCAPGGAEGVGGVVRKPCAALGRRDAGALDSQDDGGSDTAAAGFRRVGGPISKELRRLVAAAPWRRA